MSWQHAQLTLLSFYNFSLFPVVNLIVFFTQPIVSSVRNSISKQTNVLDLCYAKQPMHTGDAIKSVEYTMRMNHLCICYSQIWWKCKRSFILNVRNKKSTSENLHKNLRVKSAFLNEILTFKMIRLVSLELRLFVAYKQLNCLTGSVSRNWNWN